MLDINIMKQYLGTDLKCKIIFDDRIRIKPEILTLTGISEDDNGFCKCEFKESEGWWYINDVFPILHQLSDLTKEIEVNGVKYLGRDEFSDNEWDDFTEFGNIQRLDYKSVMCLINHHFDVCDLIASEDAIDINTLNQIK